MLVPTTSLLSVRMACLWLSNLEYHVQQLLVLNQPHHHWPPEAHQSHWLLLIIQCQQRSIHHPNHPSSGSTLAWWCTLATSSHCAWPTYGLLNFSSQGSFLVVTIIPIVAIHYSCIHIKKRESASFSWMTYSPQWDSAKSYFTTIPFEHNRLISFQTVNFSLSWEWYRMFAIPPGWNQAPLPWKSPILSVETPALQWRPRLDSKSQMLCNKASLKTHPLLSDCQAAPICLGFVVDHLCGMKLKIPFIIIISTHIIIATNVYVVHRCLIWYGFYVDVAFVVGSLGLGHS